MSQIARYRTRQGAERYAAELEAKFPRHRARACISGFDWGVQVMLPDGRTAMAGKRPKGFGLQGNPKETNQ